MSQFAKFMKQNKTVKGNEKYAATKSITDKDGNPVEWEFKHISTKENELIREDCTKEIPVKGKSGQYRQKIDGSLYVQRLICEACVDPDLNDAELQDSYGVSKPEDLLMAMVDDPGEYSNLSAFISKMNGFDTSMDEKIDQAKN